MHKAILPISLLLLTSHSSFAQESERTRSLPYLLLDPEKWSGYLATSWESSYILEGRDALDDDSLLVFEGKLARGPFYTSLWHGLSPEQNYQETAFSTGLQHNITSFLNSYVSYTRLQFPHEDNFDNEIASGFTLTALPLDLEFASDLTYSTQNDGVFVNSTLKRSFQITERWSITASTSIGFNQDFLPEGHHGANDYSIKIDTAYRIVDDLTLVGHIAQSWAINRDLSLPGDQTLGDYFHGAVGIEYSF